MGIRGFAQFINDNKLTIDHKLHSTRVVIDGSNLIFHLYSRYKISSKFGGDYSKFCLAIKDYFSTYNKCKLEPLVMFDGGFDKSDNLRTPGVSLKYNRMHTKHENKHIWRLKDVNQLIKENGEKDSVSIFPINAYEVFKDVLAEIGIQCVQCDYEGDNQMAAIANKLECPLISDDSDFYLFDLKHGFIKYSDIEQSIKKTKSQTKKYKYLKCRLYFANNLLHKFGLSIEKLHLFAALCNNRYIMMQDFKQFYEEVIFKGCNIPKFYSIFQEYDANIQTIFHHLLKWLSGLELEEAREFVLKITSDRYRKKAIYLINSMLKDYCLHSDYLNEFSTNVLQSTSDFIMKHTRITAPCGAKLPNQFIYDFHKGKLPSFLFNIISLQRNFLSPQIEEFSSQSSYKCSQYVRQVMYGILLQHDDLNTNSHEKTCSDGVIEYDRKSCTIFPHDANQLQEKVFVECITNLKTGERIPKLAEIYEVDQNSLREFLAKVMGVEMSFFEGIPTKLQLLFGCIQFWLLNCSPRPEKEFLSALTLCIMYHQLQEFCKRENTSPDPDGENNNPLYQKVPIADAIRVINKFKKFFKKPQLSETNPFDVSIVHSYSQFQTCFLDFNSLNLLTNLPFDGSKLHETTDGTMLYNLTKKLKANKDFEYIKNILIPEDSVLRFYNCLKIKIFKNSPNNYFEKKIKN